MAITLEPLSIKHNLKTNVCKQLQMHNLKPNYKPQFLCYAHENYLNIKDKIHTLELPTNCRKIVMLLSTIFFEHVKTTFKLLGTMVECGRC